MATDGNGVYHPDDLIDLEYQAHFCTRREDRFECEQDGSACLGFLLALAFTVGCAAGYLVSKVW